MKTGLSKPKLLVLPAWISICLLIACGPSRPPSPLVPFNAEELPRFLPFYHSHHKFDLVLRRHVIDGWVDYRGIVEEPELLYEHLRSLAQLEPDIPDKWTREQQLAFWINAYNAFTIQAVVERYPITGRSLTGLFFPENSILQISGVWSRLKFRVAGRELTLEQIEHDILRKRFDEPRIHFAIVCASRSCPPLRSEAYRADMLDRQLDDQAVRFINDPERGVRWDADKRELLVSKIFEWFKTDFTKAKPLTNGVEAQSRSTDQKLLAFIRPYFSDPSFQDALAEGRDIRVSYLPYDWRLNDLAERPPKQSKESGKED